MLDTTKDMQDKQREIILSKTPAQRAQMGMDMIDFAYNTVKRSILAQNPSLSKGELVVEIFKRYYRHEFSETALQVIIADMLAQFE
jgi:hypothetical protein